MLGFSSFFFLLYVLLFSWVSSFSIFIVSSTNTNVFVLLCVTGVKNDLDSFLYFPSESQISNLIPHLSSKYEATCSSCSAYLSIKTGGNSYLSLAYRLETGRNIQDLLFNM